MPLRVPHYVRVYTDGGGETHLEDVTLPVTAAPAEVGVPSLVVSEPLPASAVEFVRVVAGTLVPDWHVAPRRQLVVFLTGSVVIETSDGDSRRLPVGGAALAEDTWGRGHVTHHPPGDQRVLVIPLPT